MIPHPIIMASAFVSPLPFLTSATRHYPLHTSSSSSFIPVSPALCRRRVPPSVAFSSRRVITIKELPTIESRRGGGSSPQSVPPTQRILSILPYVIPLLDSLSFGKYVFAKVPIIAQILLPPLLPLYSVYRGIPFLAFAVFLALYITVVRNSNIPRFIRFNTSQALLIDIALIVPQLFQGVNLPLPPTISETFTTAVFYAAMLAIFYSVVKNAQGQAPDEIPLISDSVYQQIGPL